MTEKKQFDSLSGIDNCKDKRVDKNNLDALMIAKDMLFKKFSQTYEFYNNTVKYEDVFSLIRNDYLKNCMIEEKDLQNFISVVRSPSPGEHTNSKLLGLYTGCLLEIVDENNKKRGINTIIHVDGKGKQFDNLFFHSRNIGSLIVENFKGHYICSEVASNGKAEDIILKNLEGDFIGSKIGHDGLVNNILAYGIKGKFALSFCAHSGDIGTIVIKKGTGDELLLKVGGNKGNIGLLYIQDSLSRYNQILHDKNDGMIGLAVLDKVPASIKTLIDMNRQAKIKDFVIINPDRMIDENIEVDEILNREYVSSQKSKSLIRRYEIGKLKELCDSIGEIEPLEIPKVIQEMNKTYFEGKYDE